jgi:hypothetical protein
LKVFYCIVKLGLVSRDKNYIDSLRSKNIAKSKSDSISCPSNDSPTLSFFTTISFLEIRIWHPIFNDCPKSEEYKLEQRISKQDNKHESTIA